MKKNLRIAGILVVLAGLGIGVIMVIPYFQVENEKPKTVKPHSEPIAALPNKELPKKPPIVRKDPFKLTKADKKAPTIPAPVEKKMEPNPKKAEETKLPAKVEFMPKKNGNQRPIAKIILLGDDLVKLNDPDGEYTVKSLSRGKELKVIGTIKTLKIEGLNERATLDAVDLVAEEIIFTGNINSGSRALLGKTRTLKIRDVNDQSLLDASTAEATTIQLEGAVNSNSTVKLQAGKGSIEILGEINDRSQIDIAAPDGKVLFKSRGDAVVNGDAKVTILAREVEFASAINGTQTQIKVTLTKGGSLKFRRLSVGVRLNYNKADASDPALRIDAGQVDPRAQFSMLPAGKK